MVQWLRLRTPNAGGMDFIPGRGTKIPHAAQRDQKKIWNNEITLFITCVFIVCLPQLECNLQKSRDHVGLLHHSIPPRNTVWHSKVSTKYLNKYLLSK